MGSKIISVKGIIRNYYQPLRILLVSAIVLLITLVIAVLVRFAAKEPILPVEELGPLAENESAVTLYYDFLREMKSGRIIKTSYSTKSLYDVASCTRETIVFTTLDSKKRVMTYQQRQPLVFWHYPEPNYYDGTYYYYKHNGDWFIDTFNRYQKQTQPDTLGIPSTQIAQYRITDSMVYHRPDGGYQAYVSAARRGDPSCRAEITGVLDEKFCFSYIEVCVTYPEDSAARKSLGRKAVKAVSGDEDLITEKYIIEYQQINEPIEVMPPKSLSSDEIEYLQNEYQATKQARKNAA